MPHLFPRRIESVIVWLAKQKFLHFAFRSSSVNKSRFSSKSILEIGNESNAKINGNMTKSELVLRLAKRHPRLYTSDVERMVNTIFGEITEALVRGDRVELRGFGAFFVKKRNARTGRNPRTGETVAVEARVLPFFKTGRALRERLNSGDFSNSRPAQTQK